MTLPVLAVATFGVIPYELIDEPTIAARETMDDDKLADLVISIRANGLLQPIGVIKAGARYRIAFGHRRYKACGLVPLLDVPAMVFPEGTADEEAFKVAENNDREDLNAAEEATYLNELLERRCNDDVDQLCDFVKRKRGWVEDRLLLFAGDMGVFHALRAKEINFAVAKALNKCKDPIARVQFLDAAIRGGATGALVRRWVEDHDRFLAQQTHPSDTGHDGTTLAGPQPIDSALRCDICGGCDDAHELVLVYQHASCRKVEQRVRANQLTGERTP
jgi:ParB/RepB/Spo0J family partition protein